MTIIIDIFFVCVWFIFFMRALFNLGKALHFGNHKIGDRVCIIYMAIAFISAIAMIAGVMDIIQQIVLFVKSLF